MIKPESFKLDDSRPNLYFDLYKYRCTLKIPGLHYFKRDVNTLGFFERVEELVEPSSYTSWRQPFRRSFAAMVKMFIEWRMANKYRSDKFKLMIGETSANIYTNDISVIRSIDTHFAATNITETFKLTYTEIRPDYDRGVIYRVNPQHKYRLFLRSRKYHVDERDELGEFLLQNQVKMSEALKYWFRNGPSRYSINGNTYWSWDHLCFDYDDEYIATIIALKFDGVIRKICRIEKK